MGVAAIVGKADEAYPSSTQQDGGQHLGQPLALKVLHASVSWNGAGRQGQWYVYNRALSGIAHLLQQLF